ncbi:Uncharacterised protein [Brucella neotomae]|nr:Uncharacterised protein [Brucella neotomae]
MQPGIGDIELGRVFGCRIGEGVEIWPGMGVRHANQFYPMGEQHRLKIEIAWIVHQHRVAGLEEIAADEINGLRAGIGEQDFPARNVDALLAKAVGEMLAQGAEAKRLAISGEVALVVAGNGAQRPAKGLLRQPSIG